ncbi:MAG: aspartate-semialdehyde dehydrogenase [Conexivisphaerales archaeon]
MKRRVKAALLGATGAVGQRYLTMLAAHPYIELEVLMGGESAGKKYARAVQWLQPQPIPERFQDLVIQKPTVESAKDCDLIFSALPSEAAKQIEPEFAKSGFQVISEASAHRMLENVPLLIPEVNPDHLELLEAQKETGWRGGLVTTPNCTVTGLAMVLKPLVDNFEATKVVVTTMQAISGAGYPGVASLLITENVIPYIKDEEEKVKNEAKKILGRLDGKRIIERELSMAASCNRVPVIDGHTESVYVEFKDRVSVNEAKRALASFMGEPQRLKLPTAPDKPIIVREEVDRPQPRLDRMAGSVPGMSVVVGRIREGIDDRSLQLTLLSHNTVRGAAGTAILSAELMVELGYLG